MQTQFKINGTVIKRPTSFKIERYNVTNMTRIANGNMYGDLIAKKRKFSFTYAAIDSAELNNILDLIWETTSLFYTLTYIENNTEKTATVYVGSIPTDLHHTGSLCVWKDVSFDLIEQ